MTAILTKRPKGASSLKWQTYLALEDPFRAHPLPRLLGVALVVLIVLNAFLVGTTNEHLPEGLDGAIYWFSVASTGAFGIEYACRIWVADLVYPRLRPARARLRYLLSLMGLIDMLAVVPALVLYLLGEYSLVSEAVRIIRLVRLIKLSRYMLGLQSIGRVFAKRRQEIIASFMILALLTVASSVLMYDAEHAAQPDKFDSVLTGMYWAMTTITTTGYGDLVPITAIGRLIGFFVMVLAIGAVAIPAGIFSAGFVEEFRTQRRHPRKEEGAEGEEAASDAEPVAYAARETFDEFARAALHLGSAGPQSPSPSQGPAAQPAPPEGEDAEAPGSAGSGKGASAKG